MNIFYKPRHSQDKTEPYKVKLRNLWFSLCCEIEFFIDKITPILRHWWANFLFQWRKVRYIPRRLNKIIVKVIDKHDIFWDKVDDKIIDKVAEIKWRLKGGDKWIGLK